MRVLALVLVLIGCPTKDTDPTDTADPPTVDTDLPPGFGGNEGSLALLRRYTAGHLDEARLVGLFTNDAQGFLNLAQCATDENAVCLRTLPELGTNLPFPQEDRFVPASSFYQHVGLRIRLGPYSSFYEVDEAYSFYDNDVSNEQPFAGPARVRLQGVEWGPFDVEDAVAIPAGFTLIAPFQQESVIVFSDDTSFPLLWVPDLTTDANVVITVRNVETDQTGRVFQVPDTGVYDLDLAGLGITGDQQLILTIGRWTLDDLNVNGNILQVHTTAESVVNLDYRDVGLRVPVEVPEGCRIAPPRLPLGRYYGDLSNKNDDYQEVICLQSFDAANGRDGVFTLSVPPRTRTDLQYRQLDTNASMYLLDGCEPDSECILGADTNSGQGPENLRIFNPSATEFLTYTLVLDAADAFEGGLFFIDHERTALPEPDWANTCIEALTRNELAPGDYYGPDLSAFTNEFDAGFTGCTGTNLQGPDGLLPITIPAGATLEVSMAMEGDDPALLLLSDCTDLGTCLIGEDQPGDVQVLVYPNPTGADLPAFLMLDTASVSGPYFMTITIN